MMGALAAAVRPFAGGVPRRAPTAPCDASERASGKKPRRVVAPARDSEFYVPSQRRKMTHNRNCGEITLSAQELLQKRLASELDALRGLLKKAELISRRGACKLAKFAQERPIVDVLPEEKDEKLAEESKSKGILAEREEEDVHIHIRGVSTIVQTGSRPSSRSSSGSDTDGVCVSGCGRYSDECADRPALRREVVLLPEQIIVATSAQQSSSSEPAQVVVQQSGEAKKVPDVQRVGAAPNTVSLPGLIYRAKLRRQLMEMEKAVLPDQSIHPRDLQRLGIAEYGSPSVMRQLGLFLKDDAS